MRSAMLLCPIFPSGLQSNTIKYIYPSIFDWLALQNKTIFIVLAIMTGIAILNLITCLLILVLERTRMIGTLKALGAQNFTIQGVFLFHGAIITFFGLLLGNACALIIAWLQKKTGFIKLPEDAYYISEAAVDLVLVANCIGEPCYFCHLLCGITNTYFNCQKGTAYKGDSIQISYLVVCF